MKQRALTKPKPTTLIAPARRLAPALRPAPAMRLAPALRLALAMLLAPALRLALAMLLAPALLLASGCGGRTPWGTWQDAGPGQDAAPPRDSTVPRDSGPQPDSGVCEEDEWWELFATPAQEANVLSPHGWLSEGMPQGISVRLKVDVAVGGCNRLAGVRVSLDWEARQVHVMPYLWVYHGTDYCSDVLRLEPEILALPDLEPGGWTVWDDHAWNGPTLLTSFRVRECMDGEDCQCYLWDGVPGSHGDQCRYDCQCSWPLGCVYEGMVDPEWGGSCTQTCSVDSDCPLPMKCIFYAFDVPEGFCAMEREACTADSECPDGHTCQPGPYDNNKNYCQPAMEVLWEVLRCTDDCDCPWGYACTSTSDTMTRSCQIPCRGNGDCPEYLVCDEPGSYWMDIQVCSGWWD
ncbi:MAG: hypothetical protein RBU30_22955 [Polyangia bacterium]|nr:hypothetical protein [Polyangia bacterium]